ncbi:MAG: Flp family type IVb pilin [Methylophilaceae bacterium]|jgi:pilus assembly protein Flp/PilA
MRKVLFKKFKKTQLGASMVEYALLVALISIAAIVTMTTLGTTIESKFGEVSTAVENAGTTTTTP